MKTRLNSIFHWFETRIEPYPSESPKTPAKGTFRFIWSSLEGVRPWIFALAVFTAGIGITPMKKSSLDLVFHHYRQDKTTELTRTDLRPRADLQDRRTLGNGFDLVWGWTPGPAWRVQAYAGVFMPSGRFRASNDAGAGKSANAYAVGIDIRYYPGQ